MPEQPIDPTRYRVTLISPRTSAYTVGYGPTKEEAEGQARGFYVRDIDEDFGAATRIVEEAVVYDAAGSSRYEDVA